MTDRSTQRVRGKRSARVPPAVALPLALIALLGSTLEAQVRMRDDEALSPEQVAARKAILGEVVEVFELDCRNSQFRRGVSLFANGTIRVREGFVDDAEMWLGELDLGTTEALITALQQPDLSEVPPKSRSAVGDWVETCRFDLSLPGEAQQTFEFRRLDALQLPLQKTLDVAITALGMVDRSLPADTEGKLPDDYRPERGDVLVTPDGQAFRISGFLNAGEGVELVALDQPLVRFLAVADLERHFVKLRPR